MVERGLAPTRSRARDAIVRGFVSIGGATIVKAGKLVDPAAPVDLAEGAGTEYASRGALKLEAALAAFDFACEGVTAIDIGASTGGFTDVLLRRGAGKVYAVDVGRDQLHTSLAIDPRVVSLEGRDARELTIVEIPELVTAVVIDVSFISLLKVLPSVLNFAAPAAWLVALVKPQFEVGPENVGKGGIVRDVVARQAALDRVVQALDKVPGWRVTGRIESPIAGGSGNVEYLVGARLDG